MTAFYDENVVTLQTLNNNFNTLITSNIDYLLNRSTVKVTANINDGTNTFNVVYYFSVVKDNQ